MTWIFTSKLNRQELLCYVYIGVRLQPTSKLPMPLGAQHWRSVCSHNKVGPMVIIKVGPCQCLLSLTFWTLPFLTPQVASEKKRTQGRKMWKSLKFGHSLSWFLNFRSPGLKRKNVWKNSWRNIVVWDYHSGRRPTHHPWLWPKSRKRWSSLKPTGTWTLWRTTPPRWTFPLTMRWNLWTEIGTCPDAVMERPLRLQNCHRLWTMGRESTHWPMMRMSTSWLLKAPTLLTIPSRCQIFWGLPMRRLRRPRSILVSCLMGSATSQLSFLAWKEFHHRHQAQYF